MTVIANTLVTYPYKDPIEIYSCFVVCPPPAYLYWWLSEAFNYMPLSS
jgi:hypothetical protein